MSKKAVMKENLKGSTEKSTDELGGLQIGNGAWNSLVRVQAASLLMHDLGAIIQACEVCDDCLDRFVELGGGMAYWLNRGMQKLENDYYFCSGGWGLDSLSFTASLSYIVGRLIRSIDDKGADIVEKGYRVKDLKQILHVQNDGVEAFSYGWMLVSAIKELRDACDRVCQRLRALRNDKDEKMRVCVESWVKTDADAWGSIKEIRDVVGVDNASNAHDIHKFADKCIEWLTGFLGCDEQIKNCVVENRECSPDEFCKYAYENVLTMHLMTDNQDAFGNFRQKKDVSRQKYICVLGRVVLADLYLNGESTIIANVNAATKDAGETSWYEYLMFKASDVIVQDLFRKCSSVILK